MPDNTKMSGSQRIETKKLIEYLRIKTVQPNPDYGKVQDSYVSDMNRI